MGHYDRMETTLTVVQVWKVQVPAKRYFKAIIQELMAKLTPVQKCIWKSSLRRLNGYQADLVAFSIENALDSPLDSAYPDW